MCCHHRIPLWSPALQSSLKITSALKISGSSGQANTMATLLNCQLKAGPATHLGHRGDNTSLHIKHTSHASTSAHPLGPMQFIRGVRHTHPKYTDNSCRCVQVAVGGPHSGVVLGTDTVVMEYHLDHLLVNSGQFHH